MRYERKYRIEGLDKSQIMQVLRLHPAGLIPLHSPRQVNNIYFDSPDFSTYKDNVDGLPERRKYRVRWYGNQLLHANEATLEIKIRNNEVGKKENIALSPFSLLHLKKLTKEVNQVYPLASGALQPVLLNSYQRYYFTTPDQVFRLTLDWGLQYSPLLGHALITKHLYQESGICVLELKYDADYDDVADRITQYLPFRRTKNSKYISGVELCYL